jgi:hypothetical protein
MDVVQGRQAGRSAQRESVRAPRTRVRAWTGRAAMSLLTDSAVPTFVLAGTRKSRVSEMRSPARAGHAPRTAEQGSPATTQSERRRGRAPQHRWAG